jgi:hypothetical protein
MRAVSLLFTCLLSESRIYNIVKAHDGKIKINTKENEGTAFTISLPAYSSWGPSDSHLDNRDKGGDKKTSPDTPVGRGAGTTFIIQLPDAL